MVAKALKDVIAQAETWPQQDQEELAEFAREIQARRTGVYIMSDEERAAVRRGLAQADRENSSRMKSWQKQTSATTYEGAVYPGSVRRSREDFRVPAGTLAERSTECDDEHPRRSEVAARSAIQRV